jgi:hypothetical protein
MGRFRKTFSEALTYAKELMKEENETVESAAKKAAIEFKEDEALLIEVLNGGRVKQTKKRTTKQQKNAKAKTKKVANDVKTDAVKTVKKQANTNKTIQDKSLRFEYNGPADIICLNGNISTINICEMITAFDENDAKEKLYEKLFNNRLPIFIKKSNWSKCMHQL